MAFSISLIVALLAVPMAMAVAPRLGLVDVPGDDPLKVHQLAIPRVGGVALAVALGAAALVLDEPPVVWAGAGALLIVGVIDDRRGLPPTIRLAIQSAVAGAASMVLFLPEWERAVLALLVFLVAINAANLFDGLDGLLPGSAAMTATGLALLVGAGSAEAGLMWAVAGGLTAFLVFNRHPARVFLGDGGSYPVGFLLGVGLMRTADGISGFVGGVLVFGLIGADFALTLIRRRLLGRPLFGGDRSHLYDQLRDRGISTWHTVLAMWAIHALLVAVGLVAGRLSAGASLGLLAIVTLLSAGIIWSGGFVRVDERKR